jgi:hypothetical protein
LSQQAIERAWQNRYEDFERIIDRRVTELRVLLAHSVSDIEVLELATRLEEAKDVKRLLNGKDSIRGVRNVYQCQCSISVKV